MDNIRVCNLRCIEDTKPVDIKPITLLVGANSSGKSSFLRVFPLLRQSAETRTVGGLLLNGDYVDFGFFHEALRKGADPPELKLAFRLTLPPIFSSYLSRELRSDSMPVTCELRYAGRAKDQRNPSIRSAGFMLGENGSGDMIEICAEESGNITKFQVNDYQCDADDFRQLGLRIAEGTIPVLRWQASAEKNDDTLQRDYILSTPSSFELRLIKETERLLHRRTTNDKRLAIFRSIGIISPQQMLTALKEIDLSSLQASVRSWTLETPKFRRIRNLLLANAAVELLNSINYQLTDFALSVHYFQPVRASVERDYLRRDVPVSSVDPQGVNVALVLASMEPGDLQKFREWTQKYFGFEVFPESVSDGARVALRMKENHTIMEFNLADMGFGFSQMLPFLVQIWNLVEGPARGRQSSRERYVHWMPPFVRRGGMARMSCLVAIEQPELHLHPALQARLADLFVSMARISQENKLPVRFMLETHSQTFLERIGQLIEERVLDRQDVQVLLFEREQGSEEKSGSTATVRPVQYDDDGVLQKWPFGFLSASPFNPPPAHLRRLDDQPTVT